VSAPADRLLVGIGNPLRGDDAVGVLVAGRISALAIPGVVVVVAEPMELVELLPGREHVVVVDATAPHGRPGRIQLVGTPDGLARTRGAGSSHGFGVAEAVALAGVLAPLPRRLVVVGVEAAEADAGQGLSGPVAERLDDAVAAALEALGVGDVAAPEPTGT
jgi:hydrogenase maturation protease